MANPEPVFMMKDVEVLGLQIVKDNHLKLRISKEGRKFEAIGFGMAGRQVSPRIDVAFSIENSIWNGRQRLQLKLRDFREATVNNKQ
jgi:single-stranded-DNA-specific exonuclease